MIATEYIEFETAGNGHMVDITSEVSMVVEGSGISSGSVVLFVPGATGALTTIEYEPGLVEDMLEALERLAPAAAEYAHDQRWRDGNGHSHIRASLLGPSLTVPFIDGRLALGRWQQIVFLDMDNKPRHRRLVAQIMGE